MKFEGYGYEFETKYIGGPSDSLESSVVTLNSDKPPTVRYMQSNECLETKVPIGIHILRKPPKSQTRIGVYSLEGSPEDYDHDEDVLIYRFAQTMTYGEYLTKFGDK